MKKKATKNRLKVGKATPAKVTPTAAAKRGKAAKKSATVKKSREG